MILFRLRDAVDKVLREEQCGIRKGRGGVDQVFTLRLIIEKYLRCQTPLVLSFIDYEQAFDSVDKRALAKVLSLCGIPDKYINVVCAMYENNTGAVKVMRIATGFVLNLELNRVVFYPRYKKKVKGKGYGIRLYSPYRQC